MKKFVFTLSIVLCLLLATSAFASELCRRQTIFVPALCNDFGTGVNSYTRLIIHNVSDEDVNLDSVIFYSPDGTEAHTFISGDQDTLTLGRFESVTFYVANISSETNAYQCHDYYPKELGRPSFVVKWSARRWVVPLSVRAAVGIIGLDNGYSHAEASNPGIVIDGFCR